jgi:xylose isomerase
MGCLYGTKVEGRLNWRFSANASFFGAQRNRFTQYQPDRSLEEKFGLVAQVGDVEGIELRYPRDFQDLALVRRLLGQYDLALSAVNVDTKDAAYFRYGALSATDPAARQRAISLLREGMDLAAEVGSGLVTTCPLADGYDYPFQIDYSAAWGYLVETVKAVVSHRSDVTLLLEYQPHDPHAKVLLGNVGKVLYVCDQVGAPNLGANLDVGHSFAALESPAEAATLLASKGRLFYVHTNDNTGDGGDWDMISGTVHFWHWLELLFTLDRLGYDGWFSGDISAKHLDPVAAYRTNCLMIQRMADLLQRIDRERLAALVAQDGNTAQVYELLSSAFGPSCPTSVPKLKPE